MPTPKKPACDPEVATLYEKLVATVTDLEIKGAANLYTSVNGNMSSYVDASNRLALRLPCAERETFIEKYTTTLHEAYGVVQKEYVTVPESLLRSTSELQPWFAMSYEYVKTLKAKPSKKG